MQSKRLESPAAFSLPSNTTDSHHNISFSTCFRSLTGFWIIILISLWTEMRLLEAGALAVLIFIHIYDYLLHGVLFFFFVAENSFHSVKCFIGAITGLIDQMLNISSTLIWTANICFFIRTNLTINYKSSLIWEKARLKLFSCLCVGRMGLRLERLCCNYWILAELSFS